MNETYDGSTALSKAVAQQNFAIVKVLLEDYGADATVKDSSGESPLIASLKLNTTLTSRLIDKSLSDRLLVPGVSVYDKTIIRATLSEAAELKLEGLKKLKDFKTRHIDEKKRKRDERIRVEHEKAENEKRMKAFAEAQKSWTVAQEARNGRVNDGTGEKECVEGIVQWQVKTGPLGRGMYQPRYIIFDQTKQRIEVYRPSSKEQPYILESAHEVLSGTANVTELAGVSLFSLLHICACWQN